MEFVIPANFVDLEKYSDTSYYVSNLYNAKDINSSISEIRNKFEAEHLNEILNYFEYYYSLLKLWSEINDETKCELFEIIFEAFIKYYQDKNMDYSDLIIRQKNRLIFKMSCFIISRIICEVHSNKLKEKPKIVKKKTTEENKFISSNMIEEFLNVLNSIFSDDMSFLWESSIVDVDFISYMILFGIKMMGNPATSTFQTIFDICNQFIFSLLKFNDDPTDLVNKLMDVISVNESYLNPVVNLLCFLEDNNLRKVVPTLLQEIKNYDLNDNSVDSIPKKNFGKLIVDLCQKNPKLLYNNISIVAILLESDYYGLRNCTLDIFSLIIKQYLSNESLNEKEKTLRDSLFSKILEHFHDVNAYVRSHVLQVCSFLCQNEVLPLNQINIISKKCVGRLIDKSCFVRKNAVNLLKTMLVKNPYTSNFQLNVLANKIKNEESDLFKMLPKQFIESIKVKFSPEFFWSSIEVDFKESLVTEIKLLPKSIYMTDDESENCQQNISNWEKETFMLIYNKNFSEVLKLFLLVINSSERRHTLLKDINDAFFQNTEDIILEKLLNLFKTIFINNYSISMNNEILDALASQPIEEFSFGNENIKKQISLLTYSKETLNFGTTIKETIPHLIKMIDLNTSSDVVEVINFLMNCSLFGLSGTYHTVSYILPLIWVKEVNVRNAVAETLEILLFSQDCVTFFKLLPQYTNAQFHALDEYIRLYFNTSTKVNRLVEPLIGTLSNVECDVKLKVACLKILAVLGKNNCSFYKKYFDFIIDNCLLTKVVRQLDLPSEALRTIVALKKTEKEDEKFMHLNNDHKLFNCKVLLLETYNIAQLRGWNNFFQSYVYAVVHFSNMPVRLLKKLIVELLNKFTIDSQLVPVESQDNTLVNNDNNQNSNPPSTICLIRLLSAFGDLCIAFVMLINYKLYKEIKYRRSKNTINSNTEQLKDKSETLNEEIGLVNTNVDAADIENLKKLCESEASNENSVFVKIASFTSSIITICLQSNQTEDALLQISVLTLTKLMFLSEALCQKNYINLIVTCLEKSNSPKVRYNCMVCLGDLIILYPNIIEPWTSYMFSRLTDSDCSVQLCSMTILTFLILSDLIKAKSPLSEICLCLISDNTTISKAAHQFFHDLSLKDNAIYNCIPDIISKLSDNLQNKITTEQFEYVMTFLFSFINKERQKEFLIEKLCCRISSLRNDCQVHRIIYCVGLLSTSSEKAFIQLTSCFEFFKDKLCENSISKHLQKIVKDFKKIKNLSDNVMEIVNEFEKKLDPDFKSDQLIMNDQSKIVNTDEIMTSTNDSTILKSQTIEKTSRVSKRRIVKDTVVKSISKVQSKRTVKQEL